VGARIIVSYDDTDNDRDALALGRLLAAPGASLALAYVRHATNEDGARETLEQRQAEELLGRGAESIGAPDTPRHVVVHASTPDGLAELAAAQSADILVFGSDYRTARGAVMPQRSAQRLLEGGEVALALAPADFRSRPVRVRRVGVLDSDGDDAPQATAAALAEALGAALTDPSDGPVELLVVGSRPGTPPGRLELSAAAEYAIETAYSPVLAVPRGRPVELDGG
jgi:nucleotide-binding universal stress UspA family protein